MRGIGILPARQLYHQVSCKSYQKAALWSSKDFHWEHTEQNPVLQYPVEQLLPSARVQHVPKTNQQQHDQIHGKQQSAFQACL